jgi:predicted phosphodiesterase
MAKKSISSEIAKQYLERYPFLENLTLARIMYNENKDVWSSLESARGIIRRFKGASGEHNRKFLSDRRFIRDVAPIPNPYGLPESDEREFAPFYIEDVTKLLIMADIHLPYHSLSALTTTFKYCYDKGINGILLNGDIIDDYQQSEFEKDVRNKHFVEELQVFYEFLISLKRFFNVPIYYKLGNHEERYISYMRKRAPEFLGLPNFEFSNVIHAEELGITVITDKRTVKFGKLNILHGHELRGSIIPPVNPARGVYLKAIDNTLVAHFHNLSFHSENTLSDKSISCWSIGCLCERHPEWMVHNRWNHGFAIVERFEDDNFSVDNLKIIGGRVY